MTMNKQCKKWAFSFLAWLGVSAFGYAQETVTLAEWNFEATTNETGWFNKDGAPHFAPDVCQGESAQYDLTAMSSGRYWQTAEGHNTRVLRIENDGNPNDVTDYADAAQHDVYYEVSFPTTGYENIQLEYALAYGGNAAVGIETVFSANGGSTWVDAGARETGSGWWMYTPYSVSLSANNKESVKVRLMAPNGLESNWNLDFVRVKGQVVQGPAPVDTENATVAWAFNEGASSPTAAVASVPAAVSATSYELGSKLSFSGTYKTSAGVVLSKLTPSEKLTSKDEASYVAFSFTPKKGVTFAPKKLNVDLAKVGTSGGNFYIEARSGDQVVSLAENYNPATKNALEQKEYSLASLPASGEKLEVRFYVCNLNSGKEVGLANITLTGDLAGTPEAVPVYTLEVSQETPGAATLTVTPSGTEFDEGTQITVEAKENFGYHFQNWTDAAGEVVSTENPYTFTLQANTQLVANFTKNNVYALRLNLTNGARTNLVAVQPEGHVVDGVHYYEEGTNVKLTAINNRLLTFIGWEDQSTTAERVLLMDADKDLTANFSACDYIVGWDLYEDQPASQRAADYKSDTENAGLLSLRNAEGATYSWLALGHNKGMQNGRYGARIWKALTAKLYFEVSFSTVGYTNVTVNAALGDDYNAYETMYMQYSLNGVDFTTVGTYTLPYRGWQEQAFTLPAEADNQARVYVRWMPDYEKGLVGVESANDGTTIADIYVTADAQQVDDDQAPVLLSSNPADLATGVSATGSIILTFDEKIVAASGQATLGGEALPMVVSGKTAVFKYAGLDYNRTYTFELPAGALTDRSGNAFAGCTLTFTTMERLQPAARLYDAVVAADGSGDYTSIQAAIDAVEPNRSTPWLIFIKKGVYKEHVDIPANKPYIYLIGQGRQMVSIEDGLLSGGDQAVSVDKGATVVARPDNLYMEGINFVNSYGRDKKDGPQALALYTMADRVVLNKCGLISYQDTWLTAYTANKRQYAKDCWIEGAVDFIYGQGNIYMESDTLNIVRKSGGYIVAPNHVAETTWGYVFQNNVITAPGVPSETSVWLGRPWHNAPKTVFINTKAEVTIPAAGWYQTMGGIPALWAEYNTMDADGNPVDLSQRNTYYYYTDDNGQKQEGYSETAVLTAEQAARYTLKNVLGGDDAWNPAVLCEATAAPRVSVSAGELVWEAVPYAICYVVTKNGVVTEFTTECRCAYEEGAAYSVQAANEYGALSPAGQIGSDTKLDVAGQAPAELLREEVFSLDGKRMPAVRPGVNVVRKVWSDGSVTCEKLVR